MIQLNNMMKLEKYLQDKVMIRQLAVYSYFEKNYRIIIIAADLSKQKVLELIQEQFNKLFLLVQ